MFNKFHENHKRLWDWLSKNPRFDKTDWPEWKENGGDVEDVCTDCFACEYDELVAKEKKLPRSNCTHCPITWRIVKNEHGVRKSRCYYIRSEFYEWQYSDNMKERVMLAEIIRDLPWEDKA